MNLFKFAPMGLFSLLFGKLLIYGASWTDAGILLIVGAYAAYYETNIQNKALKLMHTRLDEVDKHLTTIYKTQEDLKTRVSASQVAQNFRPANLRG